jgi:hypothetical protein
MAACLEAAMSTATIYPRTIAAIDPPPGGGIERFMHFMPPEPPRTIFGCRQALLDSGALHFLTAPGAYAQSRIIPIDLGNGPVLRLPGYFINDEKGKPKLALVSSVLDGTYLVTPFGGRGFMSLGVQLDATDFELSLVEGTNWTRTKIGRVPLRLPFRQVVARGHEDQAKHSQWVEFVVPGRGLLTWSSNEHRHHRREGAYVVGWKGVHRSATGDRAVFIKVIKEPEGLAYILENERHLRRAAGRNPAVAAFAPLASEVWTHGISEIAGRIPGERPGCAVVIEPLIDGPTLADLASGLARLDPGGKDRIHHRQVAACGRLAAQGLFELNRLAPRGDRLLAPDATKLDNLMCKGIAANASGLRVPTALVCPDRDHYVSESNPRWRLHGTMFGTDVRSIRTMMADNSFDLVEAAHVFQVGRLLLALSTADAKPEGEDGYGPDLDANLEIERRHYARALARFDQQNGAAPSPAATALGALITSCCDPAPERRPSLPGVMDCCQRIADMSG